MTATFTRWLGLLAALLLVGCTVGEGAGAVSGPLFILGCGGRPDLASRDRPGVFDLNPKFFAAEPLLDIGASGGIANSLIIRLQANGRRREVNDVLNFIIPDSGQVARCVHDAITPPNPADAATSAADDGGVTGSSQDDSKVDNCYRGPMGVRVRVGPDALVRSSFTPNATCPCQSKSQPCSTTVVGTAVSTKRTGGDGAWESWIEFAEFGEATNPNATVGDDFKVDYGQRLHATAFSLTIEDDALYWAKVRGQPLLPGRIGGALAGWFDFDMERGQGAQTFP